MRDARAIQQSVPLIKLVSPQVDARIQVIYGNTNWNTTYRGVSPEFLSIRRWKIDEGAPFTEHDVAVSANVDVGDPQLRTDHPWYPGELACSTFERLFATQAEVYERVVGVKPVTDQPVQTNLLLTTTQGHQLNLLLVSVGQQNTGIQPVDVLLAYLPSAADDWRPSSR